ncbi:jg21830 [Pararge aegeria aegeria]|uniref:Jg21830 protein n=1 Tax=Pararge aegeria aegeria TaxID=348720 RepID=A0A8S4QLL1_9NEOP|nr:jg21830 [Pararge aegeria aegeria]
MDRHKKSIKGRKKVKRVSVVEQGGGPGVGALFGKNQVLQWTLEGQNDDIDAFSEYISHMICRQKNACHLVLPKWSTFA